MNRATMSNQAGLTFASTQCSHPGKGPVEFYVLVLSKRNPLPFEKDHGACTAGGQMRKKLMLAIVDKESDIIFCEACEADGATARALHQLRLGLQKHLIVLQTEEGLPSRIRFEVIDDLDAPKKIVVAKIWKNACCNKPGCVTCSQLESGHGPYCDALAPLYHVEGIGLASGMHVAEGRGVVEPLKPPPGHCDRPAILEG